MGFRAVSVVAVLAVVAFVAVGAALLPLARAEGEPMEFDVQAQPRVVAAGEGTVLTVTAVAGGAPVADVAVALVVDGGAFGLAAREATGSTDERGIFRVVWRTGPAEEYAEARFHLVDYTTTTEGGAQFTGRLLLRVVPPAPRPEPAPPRPHLYVTALAAPPYVSVGGTAAIAVGVSRGSPEGERVVGARVRVDVDGGRFLDSGSTTAEGETDRAGIWRVQWTTGAAEGYREDTVHRFAVRVTKDGIENGRARLEVGVSGPGRMPEVAPEPLRPMFVEASAEPTTGRPSGGALVTVLARADGPGGFPLAGATVTVTTRDGRLGGRSDGTATGTTDRAGRFDVVWQPEAGVQTSATHLFGVRVTCPGYREGRARAQLRLGTSAAPPPTAREIAVTAQADSATVRAGDATTITVRVQTLDRKPVANAKVTVVAGGGSFDGTSRTSASGWTGSDGLFRTRWRTGDPSVYRADTGYTFSVTAGGRGMEDAQTEVEVRVLAPTSAVPAPDGLEPGSPGGSLVVSAQARPSTIPAGGTTLIVVSVHTADRRPVAGADVWVAAGGGSFGRRSGSKAQGRTGRDGTWRVAWRTGPARAYTAAGEYRITVAARKRGRGAGRGSVLVRVKPTAAAPTAPTPPPTAPTPPPARLSVAVAARAPTVSAGSSVQVAVRVVDAAGRPVPGAAVALSASAGTFGGGSEPRLKGATDGSGYLVAEWRTGPASQYRSPTPIEIVATATKPGHAQARAQTTLTVQPLVIK